MADYIYPPKDVEACLTNDKLQKELEVPDELRHMESDRCVDCKDVKLKWYRFISPKETWEMLCGRDSWLLICSNCKRQYKEDIRIMN